MPNRDPISRNPIQLSRNIFQIVDGNVIISARCVAEADGRGNHVGHVLVKSAEDDGYGMLPGGLQQRAGMRPARVRTKR
jgi:hypothetical protein